LTVLPVVITLFDLLAKWSIITRIYYGRGRNDSHFKKWLRFSMLTVKLMRRCCDNEMFCALNYFIASVCVCS